VTSTPLASPRNTADSTSKHAFSGSVDACALGARGSNGPTDRPQVDWNSPNASLLAERLRIPAALAGERAGGAAGPVE
jgi:hypothetical protein